MLGVRTRSSALAVVSLREITNANIQKQQQQRTKPVLRTPGRQSQSGSGEDEHDDDDTSSNSSSTQENEGLSDEEFVVRDWNKRTKRPARGGGPPPAAKKPRATLPKQAKRPRAPKKPAQPAAAAKPGRAAAVVTSTPPDSDSLYDAVRIGKAVMLTVVDTWVDSYKEDQDEATLSLINFFIQSSGCKGRVTMDMYRTMEYADIIRKMTEGFDEESAEYPLSQTGLQAKRFRAVLADFVLMLVRQSRNGPLYELKEMLLGLLTGLTDSQVRAFRHTATFSALKLQTGLVEVSLSLTESLVNASRQLQAERSKEPRLRAVDKIEGLLNTIKQLNEHQEDVENMMRSIFKSVFVHRYRDSFPEIRALCMEEIGVWMKAYSDVFLDDGYLKYIGWTLNDKQGEVRLRCLSALQGLYSEKEFFLKLELFTKRFKERIVSMVNDKELDVAVKATQVLVSILENNEESLSAEDCKNVYNMVFSLHRQLATAAGEFLYKKLQSHISNSFDDEEDMDSHSRRKTEKSTVLLRLLVTFLLESEMHQHAAYVVDSLWEHAREELHDWEAMTSLLLPTHKANSPNEGLSDNEEAGLIDIMVCCVKQAAEGVPPIGRLASRKTQSAKEKKNKQDEQMRLTQHFIIAIPQLLAKYSVDEENVVNLLQVPMYFDLEVYTNGRLEKHLDTLVRQVGEVVQKHVLPDVLDGCSRALVALAVPDSSVHSRALVSVSSLMDLLVDRFAHALPAFMEQDYDADGSVSYDLLSVLKRLTSFYNGHDLTRLDVHEGCLTLIKHADKGGDVPDQILIYAIKCVHYSLFWRLSALSEDQPDKKEVVSLRRSLRSFLQLCNKLLIGVGLALKEQVFLLLCDTLLVFGHSVAEQGRHALLPLVVQAEPELQAEMGSFIIEHIFSDENIFDQQEDMQNIEVLHKRRCLLAAYCKLLVYGAIDMRAGVDIFRRYVEFYINYGDIIKETLSRLRQIDLMEYAHTLALTLKQMFTATLEETSNLVPVKELARRFSLTFGMDAVRSRHAIAALHKNGIDFAFEGRKLGIAPPNILFLEVLCEFSPKLLSQDKKTLCGYMESYKPPTRRSVLDSEWQPVFTYRNSLTASAQPDGAGGTPATDASAGRRIRTRHGSANISVSTEASGLEWGARTPIATPATPQLTSTVLRGGEGVAMGTARRANVSSRGSMSAGSMRNVYTRSRGHSLISEVTKEASDEDDDDEDNTKADKLISGFTSRGSQLLSNPEEAMDTDVDFSTPFF